MLKSLVRVVAVSAFAIVAAVSPVAASAAGSGGGGATSNGMTITVGSPITLQGKLLVTVPITVSCTASVSIDPTVSQPGSLGVMVQQAAGKTLVFGSGGVELDSCSPTPQTFAIQVTPQNAPFKNGTAIISASGGICDFNIFPQTCYSATTAWQTVKL